jgi:hypothetical protein
MGEIRTCSRHGLLRLVLAVAAMSGPARAGQSLFWLQSDGGAGHLGGVQNPQVRVPAGDTIELYLWLHKDGLSAGFDGISFDVKLISADGGSARATLSFDTPAGRWFGATGGGTRQDSGGTGVDDCNAIDLTNTDTLAGDPLRLATLRVTGVSAGTVQLFLCVGAMGIADAGNNAVVWLGLAGNSVSADTQLISGGVPGLCSNVPEAVITVVRPVKADFDRDNDVDQEDFGHLQQCLAGSILPQTDPACADTLLTDDPFVDEGDVAAFVQCMSGPGAAPAPGCN